MCKGLVSSPHHSLTLERTNASFYPTAPKKRHRAISELRCILLCSTQTVDTAMCKGLGIGQNVTFEVSLSVSECPVNRDEWKKDLKIYPVGLTEALILHLDLICECDCELPSEEVRLLSSFFLPACLSVCLSVSPLFPSLCLCIAISFVNCLSFFLSLLSVYFPSFCLCLVCLSLPPFFLSLFIFLSLSLSLFACLSPRDTILCYNTECTLVDTEQPPVQQQRHLRVRGLHVLR